MPKTVVILIIFLTLGVILLGLTKQITNALQSGERLNNQAEEVNKLQEENKQLKDNLERAKSYQSWEEIARDKLNLSKSGETVVVVPDDYINRAIQMYEYHPVEINIPNWQGWLNLFFR